VARILITGAGGGLGALAARTLLGAGHEVVVHARRADRLDGDVEATDAVLGDLSDPDRVRDVAAQAERLGPFDAIVHNAAVYSGPDVLRVNVVAPYLLTALIPPPRRLVYLTSGMQRGGRADLTRVDWERGSSYADSKLFVTTLALAVARLWPGVRSHAVDPGWVPTRMGGPGAPDDLRLGHLTQEWLATSEDPEALTSGGVWYHQERSTPPAAAADPAFQDELLAALAHHTGVTLPRLG
jgi:NAD(P)-dependent dehydrogenase (short-subunit alcohol dehydrogenase family)